MSETISSIIGAILGILLFALYVTGMVTLVRDDHHYTAKNVVVGFFLFPYAWYVGGKHAYYWATTSAAVRQTEDKCLDLLDDQGLSRRYRVFLCECVMEGAPIEQCTVKYENKYRVST